MTHRLGSPTYVRFTTFRKSGDAVSTPVWFAPDLAGAYVFSTDASSGKVKRLRHTPRVEVAASDVRGRVAAGAPTYSGTAEVIDDVAGMTAARAALAERYGLMWRLVGLGDAVRKLARRPSPSVIIRATLKD
jgi:PPOX class probable F420-dependent enzyme